MPSPNQAYKGFQRWKQDVQQRGRLPAVALTYAALGEQPEKTLIEEAVGLTLLASGSERAVFDLGRAVLKIAFGGSESEAANRQEAALWRMSAKHPSLRSVLVPTLSADSSGHWLVMEKALTVASAGKLPTGLPVSLPDIKPSNWGRHDGEFKLLDYSMWSLARAATAVRVVARWRRTAAVPIYAAFVYLSRTKNRGLDADCDAVQDLIEDLKKGDGRAATQAAKTLARHPKLRGFQGFQGFQGVVVPAPRSTMGGASLATFAKAMVAAGVGSRVEVPVVRESPVESSRMRRRQGLPGVPYEEHMQTMKVEAHGISPDEPVLVLDDIVTTGATIRAVAARLRQAGHQAPISGAAAGYHEPDPSEHEKCPVDFQTLASKRADLAPPLGWPGGPCHVVRRIEQEVRNERTKKQLTDKAEKGQKITNPEAAKIYDLEAERGEGIAKQLIIGVHAQYRMDLRQVTVPQVRVALKSFSKILNDLKSQRSPKYDYYAQKVQRSDPIEWTDQRLNLTIVFAFTGHNRIKLISVWWQGEADPPAPYRCDTPLRVAARWQRRGGLFQAPPAMLKSIGEWVESVYASYILRRVNEALDRYEARGIIQAKIQQLEEVLADIPKLLEAAKRRTKRGVKIDFGAGKYWGTLEIHWIPERPERDFGRGVVLAEPAHWKVALPGNVYYNTRDDGPDPTAKIKEALTEFRPRLVEVLGQTAGIGVGGKSETKPLSKKMFVELKLMEKKLQPLVRGRGRRRVTDLEETFPIDVRGWKYYPEMSEEVENRLEGQWSRMNVQLTFKPKKGWAGLWQVSYRKLSIVMPSMALKTTLSVAKFDEHMVGLWEVLDHELQHLGQDLLKAVKQLKGDAGLPGKSIRDPALTPSGKPRDPAERRKIKERFKRVEHPLRDTEFYPNITSMLRSFRQILKKYPKSDYRAIAREYVGADPPKLLRGPSSQFKALRDRAPRAKWQKAVKEFLKAVEPLLA